MVSHVKVRYLLLPSAYLLSWWEEIKTEEIFKNCLMVYGKSLGE